MNESDDPDLEAMESIVSDQRASTCSSKRPQPLSQEQMSVLNHVHESFARELARYLSERLRTTVGIRPTAVDQALYSEHLLPSGRPSTVYVAEVQELNQKVVFELDPRLVVFTIETLFGGPGVFTPGPRSISKIEEGVLGKVIQRAFREMEKAWRQIQEVHLSEDGIESNTAFVPILPGVEAALVISTFEVSFYDQRSFINICYPYLLLDRILGRTAMTQWISNATSKAPLQKRVAYENGVRDRRGDPDSR